MTRRGQDLEARLARWRDGTCPIHGLGFVTPPGETPPAPRPDRWYREPEDVGAVVACPHEECTIVAAQWPGKDKWHSLMGWRAGPDDIKAMLLKANEISADSDRPGRSARNVRTEFQLEE